MQNVQISFVKFYVIIAGRFGGRHEGCIQRHIDHFHPSSSLKLKVLHPLLSRMNLSNGRKIALLSSYHFFLKPWKLLVSINLFLCCQKRFYEIIQLKFKPGVLWACIERLEVASKLFNYCYYHYYWFLLLLLLLILLLLLLLLLIIIIIIIIVVVDIIVIIII